MGDDMIKEGVKVILKKDGVVKTFPVHRQRPVWVEKVKFVLDDIIGHRYGSIFEVRNGKMVKVKREDQQEKDTPDDCSSSKDNRNLLDQDCNQKLSKDDIVKMRKEGLAGEDIIGKLIENSATFENKTEYSQAKYIKKKKRKHLLVFTVLKPNTRLLAEMYYSKAPAKIQNMRVDTLSQVLCYGNVFAHSNVAVVDTMQGLLLGAVLEKCGGFSKVIHFHHGSFPEPTRPIVGMFDFPSSVTENLLSFPLNCLNKLRSELMNPSGDVNSKSICEKSLDMADNCDSVGVLRGEDDNIIKPVTAVESKTCDTVSEPVIDSSHGEVDPSVVEISGTGSPCEEMDTGGIGVNSDNENGDEQRAKIGCKRKFFSKENEAKRLEKQRNIADAKCVLLERKIDSLLIASKYHPTPLVLNLIEYVAPSRPVVIYSQYKEPLMDAYTQLREKGFGLSFRMTETWLREYQILPSRTHPNMKMSGGSGYILTFITSRDS